MASELQTLVSRFKYDTDEPKPVAKKPVVVPTKRIAKAA
jgi:hypothetical protein